MPVRFLDLTRQHKEVEADASAALTRVLKSGRYVLDKEVKAFEDEWASFCNVRGAVAVGSGTDAIALALVASGAVRKGRRDEVITSPLTAAYTALAIMNAGGVPVFADIDPQTLTLDPHKIEQAITSRTRAFVPVHLYGHMADMTALGEIAARRGLVVIEDAAQAHGASLSGVRTGCYGQASAFSFYPTKNLGAYGDGGAITSNDMSLIERVKVLRQGGHAPALTGSFEGRNSRLDEVQAALLRIKLKNLDRWNERRRSLARTYNQSLVGNPRITVPVAREPEAHVYHLYVVQHPRRDRLRCFLAERGIETMIHYPFLLHQQRLFRQDGQRTLPIAEQVAKRILSLPLYPQLRPGEQRAVIDAVSSFKES